VAQGYGSLRLMTSVLLTPDGQSWKPSCPWHRDAALSRASEGQGNFDQLDRLDLRLEQGLATAPKLDTTKKLAKFGQNPGESLRRHRRGRLHDQDLALLVGADQRWLSTTGFLDKVSDNLAKAMAA